MNLYRIFTTAIALGGAVTGALLSGCATATQPAAMTPTALTVAKKHTQSVSLKVVGGSETSAAGAPKISDADFETALRAAIEQSRLFASVAGEADAGYHLDIAIVRLEQPMFGASMKVTLETNWTLRRRGENVPVWQKAITSTFTAGATSSFVGVTRVRLANEGAARTNIEDALKQISALTLP